MNSKYIDIINNSYLAEYDKDMPWEELHKRDRVIYLQGVQAERITGQSTEHDILKLWQNTRLTTLLEKHAPGQFICSAAKYTTYILFCFSLLFGFTAMTSFLYYTGQKAVNILSFFLTFIVVQWCFLLISFFLQKKIPQPPWFFFIKWTINFLYKKLLKQGHTKKKDELHSLLGVLWQKADFIALLKPYAFVLQQKIVIALNFGLLLALSLRIIGTDLAFGWQSTLHITSENMFRMVQALSLPWAWTDLPTPDIAQIAGSKIILKDGLFHLLQSDLVSWWPFLIMSLISYSFLPRCVVLIYALIKEQQNLKQVCQNDRNAKNILQRMLSPVVESHIEITKRHPTKNHTPDTSPLFTEQSHQRNALLFIPYDIYPLEPSALQQWLHEEAYSCNKQYIFMKSYGEDEALLKTLEKSERDIVIFMEAHMPPLAEFLSFVQRLQKKTETYVHISLIKITKHSFSKTIQRDTFQIWHQKINALGNTHLRVIPPKFEEEQ